MATFAILEEQDGHRHWVRSKIGSAGGVAPALGPPPKELQYLDRETAESDAEVYRMIHANDVERAKRRRPDISPATFTVVPVEPEQVAS